MSAKKAAAPPPSPAPTPVPAVTTEASATPEPFYERHPKIANVLFAALCVYLAMLCLLALDQTFHWGIFGPKIPPPP